MKKSDFKVFKKVDELPIKRIKYQGRIYPVFALGKTYENKIYLYFRDPRDNKLYSIHDMKKIKDATLKLVNGGRNE